MSADRKRDKTSAGKPVDPDRPGQAKPAGPGRPKDLAKRAAILDAAKSMFTQYGFGGASMDQIAAEAGVSKLTVYSHFGDKETLFAAAVRAYCEQQLPSTLFESGPGLPLRERLLAIARAFYAMISKPEAIAGHRILCTPQLADSALPKMFWEAGPQRVQDEFSALLRRRIAIGELDVPDVARASAQFFTLLKGEPHAQMVFGCCGGLAADEVQAHLAASVDLFLRAYGTRGGAGGSR
ncbi:TetR/AcrR family transcriptional regulator [Lysobacter sp. D1-1-M9]|uniref:TetR/AcrR family transcriptional regulator n=2 Tax=Novilysobacter TaxID=3382699 RepID=UPI002FC63256